MKINIEQFGAMIGVDRNITEALLSKELHLLLTIIDDKNKSRNEFVLNKTEALFLCNKINDLLNDKTTKDNGFRYAENKIKVEKK